MGEKQNKIFVIGDIMLDEYIKVTYKDSTDNYPVVAMTERRYALGGAANVAANLSNIDNVVRLVGAVGEYDDPAACTIRRLCQEYYIDHRLVPTSNRVTTSKIRISSPEQKLLRLDLENITRSGAVDQEKPIYVCPNLAELIQREVLQFNPAVAVISDYDKGFCVTTNIIAAMTSLVEADTPILVDPPSSGAWEKYAFPQTLFKPNLQQALKCLAKHAPDWQKRYPLVAVLSNSPFTGPFTDREMCKEGAFELFRVLRQYLNFSCHHFRYLWITLGALGSIVGSSNTRVEPVFIAADQLDEANPIGAGDVAMAVMADYIATRGYDFPFVVTGAMLATKAATVACTQDGTYVMQKELLDGLRKGLIADEVTN